MSSIIGESPQIMCFHGLPRSIAVLACSVLYAEVVKGDAIVLVLKVWLTLAGNLLLPTRMQFAVS